MTKERGRVAPPEQKSSASGKAVAGKGAKTKAAPGAKLAQSVSGAPPGKAKRDAGEDSPSQSTRRLGGKVGSASSRAQTAGRAAGPGKKRPSSAPPDTQEQGAPEHDAPEPSAPEPSLEDLATTRLEAGDQSLSAAEDQAEREVDPKGWTDGLVDRWVRRGQLLLQKLAQHGAADHEYRADLKEGRFVWIAPDGNVSVEAQAAVLCSWSRSTSVMAMAWADPLVRYASVDRIDGLPTEHDDVDEEKAWHLAMEAAELSGAEYLYRVPTPHAWYFLALSNLTFDPKLVSFRPGTPVGLVLRELAQTREAIESRAEPADVIRERLSSFGSALLHQAEYAYRNTDWVARLERTGKCLGQLATRLPRQSYGSIVAGQPMDEWIERDLALDLIQSISLLEDEWSLFA